MQSEEDGSHMQKEREFEKGEIIFLAGKAYHLFLTAALDGLYFPPQSASV